MQQRVLVVQRRMTHYRVPFFEALRGRLAERNVDLVLAYGSGTPAEAEKADGADMDWGVRLRTHYLLGDRLCYQPLKEATAAIDMLVVTLENKLLCNLWHQYGPVPYKVGLWGHGANLQGDAHSWRERFKRQVARKADWWFGYTELSRPLIARSGFPAERVTVLNNSVDTAEMTAQYQHALACEPDALRIGMGLRGRQVGVFVGSLYSEKRIEFLLEAAQRIRAEVPDFELLLVGGGPQRDMVAAFCAQHAWAQFKGVLKGQQKVNVLAAATVMLNPGLVGLGILDSFVCQVPMLTTDCGLHSPEIAYLQSGVNGLMTPDTMDAYVHEAVALLRDDGRMQSLREGCAHSARQYTVDNMAVNFADGVRACLDAPMVRRGS